MKVGCEKPADSLSVRISPIILARLTIPIRGPGYSSGATLMVTKKLKIDSLLLDQSNPRIPPVANQREALQQVIDDQQEKLVNLAESIVEEGISPIDLWFVEKSEEHPDRWVVLEGNRRIAALKILHNPSVLPSLVLSKAIRKRFEAATKSFDVTKVEPITCIETTRRDAAPWIQRRHTGEDEGRGLVSWNGQASARFRGGEPALQALEFVRQHGNLTAAEDAALSGRFITTLRRLIETPDVRNLLGLDLKKNELFSTVPRDELIKGLKRIVLDLAEKKINVTALKKKDQMVSYVSGLDKADKPDLTKRIPAQNLGQLTSAPKSTSGATAGPSPSPKARSHTTPPRTSIVPKPYVLKVASGKPSEVYEELKTLHLARNRHAISVLFRVFLELSVDHHLVAIGSKLKFKPSGGSREIDKTLKMKIIESAGYFVNKGAATKDFASINRMASDSKGLISLEALHSYVHSRFSTPLERDLTAMWDNAQPLLTRIWA